MVLCESKPCIASILDVHFSLLIAIRICAIAIVRQYILYTASETDPAWQIVDIKMWM